MWSGPRNISTAVLRAFENRPDTAVTDEPFYAHYLVKTALNHPGREEVIASQEQDWDQVVTWLLGPVPNGKRIWYQKHMAQHNLPGVNLDWTEQLTNCFLIRDPREVILSYIKNHELLSPDQLGFPQQAELFDRIVQTTGVIPPIVDARDILNDPRPLLTRLCEKIGISFLEQMLFWPKGPRDSDGVWGKYWYHNVQKSTGFKPYTPSVEPLPDELTPIYLKCQRNYNILYRHRLGGL